MGGCATVREPGPSASAAPLATPPATMQYLYGSAEAAAASAQAYAALTGQVAARLPRRASAVLAAGATLDRLRFAECGDRPTAVLFDMDETLVLNLGYEYDEARSGASFDAARWGRWEQSGAHAVSPAPGAVTALTALRAMGVTPIVNSNRSAANAKATAAALTAAGLGDFRHGETMFLKGDVDGKSAKDGRRALIAQRWCVIAMAGDQLGDFSDLFTGDPAARRAAAQAPAVASMWGSGWFILPNPVYGSGVTGDWDQVFPMDKRWADPAGKGGR
ncbi:acid phosphatase [Sphingomonas sp. SRS2]|nr:acid phosphatase [Sphingomonas sp. SRS2]